MSKFQGALDRFGRFFIEPLFPNEVVSREVSAIDSECKKNLQDDNRRLHQVQKELANASQPYSRFSVGKRKTLHDSPTARGLSLRDMVVDFFTDHYSANRMKLAVLGQDPLDTLQRWVEKIFSKVPTRGLSQNWWDMPLYTEDQLLRQTFIKPVLGGPSLELQFMYRDEARFHESHPSWYLTFLLGHKGPGSIFALVRSNGWADDLQAGNYTPCWGSGLSTIDVELTKNGLVHYRDIVGIIFRYIAIVREQPPQKWVVDEMMHICQTAFRFEQKCSPSSTVSFLAGIMQQPYSRTMLLSGPCVIRKFDPDLIRESMSYLRPDNFRLTILSSEYKIDLIAMAHCHPCLEVSNPASAHMSSSRFILAQTVLEKLGTRSDIGHAWMERNLLMIPCTNTCLMPFETPATTNISLKLYKLNMRCL